MSKFSDEKLKRSKRLSPAIRMATQERSMPVLHLAQDEFGGWLSPETMDYVASLLRLDPIEVYEVATFYSMYNLKPVAAICSRLSTGPCMLRGSDQIIDYINRS